VQAMPRNARIDVEELCHVVVNIGASTAPCIATKERTSLVTIVSASSRTIFSAPPIQLRHDSCSQMRMPPLTILL